MVTPDRHVRTRLYFTSQSHVHAVLNVLRYGGLLKVRPCDCHVTWGLFEGEAMSSSCDMFIW